MSDTVSEAYAALTNDVCVRLGYCGAIVAGKPSHVDHFIPKQGRVTAAEFADWVIQADGAQPSDPAVTNHKRDIRAAFIRFMGKEDVDASEIWND